MEPDNKMTIERFAAMSAEERKAWIESPEHTLNCAAYSEGQLCCLEKLLEG